MYEGGMNLVLTGICCSQPQI